MRLIPLLLIFALLAGCSTTTALTSVPKSNEDFLLSKTQLDAQYPEIPANEKRLRIFSPSYPTETSLFNELGSPKKTDRDVLPMVASLGLLALLQTDPIAIGIYFAIFPDIPSTHYFQKGNYCIEAHTIRSLGGAYSKRMMYWKWKENAKTCE